MSVSLQCGSRNQGGYPILTDKECAAQMPGSNTKAVTNKIDKDDVIQMLQQFSIRLIEKKIKKNPNIFIYIMKPQR